MSLYGSGYSLAKKRCPPAAPAFPLVAYGFPVFHVMDQTVNKTIYMHGKIEFADPQKIFKLLYDDDTFTKYYHKEVNNDEDVEVTAWTPDGHRKVIYSFRLSGLPRILIHLAGCSIIQVTETQKRSQDGNVFAVHCEISTNFRSSASLVLFQDIKFCPAEKSCAVDFNLILELKGKLWGLQDLLEEFVDWQARSAFRRWLNVVRLFCEGKLGLAKEELHDEDDLFYDIAGDDDNNDNEALPTQENGDTNFGASATTSHNPRPFESIPHFQDWLGWRTLCVSSDNHEKLLDIEKEVIYEKEKLLEIEKKVFSLSSYMEGYQWPIHVAWSLYCLGIATGLVVTILHRKRNSKLK